MFDVERINEILRDCYDARVEAGPMPEGVELVDVWMEVPLNVSAVRRHEAEMIELLKDWPSESWGQPVPALGQEINYLIAGAVLDSQQMAFVLFAFGKLLGWWEVMDPSTLLGLSKDDERAIQIVGMGFVAVIGYKPADVDTSV